MSSLWNGCSGQMLGLGWERVPKLRVLMVVGGVPRALVNPGYIHV